MAVCSSWARSLHPSSFPVHECSLVFSHEAWHEDPKAEWLCRIRPALHSLTVKPCEADDDEVKFGRRSLQAICRAVQALQGESVSGQASAHTRTHTPCPIFGGGSCIAGQAAPLCLCSLSS